MSSQNAWNLYLLLGIVSSIGTGIFAAQAQYQRSVIEKIPKEMIVESPSSPAEFALADHLKKVGARLYGAYSCVRCYEQMYLFGQQAAQQINRIECDPEGKNAQPEVCKEAGIRSYPTWEIKGAVYQGIQSLNELAKSSGYQGDRRFKNAMPTHIPEYFKPNILGKITPWWMR